jgi:formylglycine-generating enzyme required for sulfatase activity
MIRRSIVLGVLVLGSCDRTSHRFDIVDQPEPVPQATVAPEVAPPPPKRDPSGAELPAECTWSTGRNGKGECVQLATRMLPHSQQVQVPEGRFVVGDVPPAYDTSPSREDPRVQWPGQPPRHAEVKSFWMDLHEVSREEYEKCIAGGKCTKPVCEQPDLSDRFPADEAPKLPQTCVTHEQAAAFCAFVGARLPTANEWEFAARGVDARIYPWGNDIRDELAGGLAPRTNLALDTSYFGLRAMGTSAVEWVADPFDPEASLRPFVEGEFRRADGPLRKAEAKRGQSFAVKSGRVGHVQTNPKADAQIGFRCAADLGADVEVLQVPAKPAPIPWVWTVGELTLFGGVAEAVDRDEAAAFCDKLKVDAEGRTWTEWRLPTIAEVLAIAESFRGPGPFWAADGAVVQVKQEPPAKPTWEPEDAKPTEALAARCVHATN